MPCHPLDDAYLRLKRAEEHFEELKALCADVCAAQVEATIIKSQPNITIGPGEFASIVEVESAKTTIPCRCKILVGDVASNLRSALNYLTGELAELDSGAERRTQFPIEKAPESFKGQSTGKGFLVGLSVAHLAALEQLQPYNGCQWTADLASLSNLDKHSKLIAVAHDYRVTGTVNATDTDTSKLTVDMNIKPVIRIALDDGLPLIETLEIIQSQVSQTLDAFKPEFK
jgi:hypothetical protein